MADKKTLKEKVKSYVKTVKDLAAAGALGTGGVPLSWKKKKKKEEVVDPDETFGGKRIRGVAGPEIKPAKRSKGGGIAQRGLGRAFNKGGKV